MAADLTHSCCRRCRPVARPQQRTPYTVPYTYVVFLLVCTRSKKLDSVPYVRSTRVQRVLCSAHEDTSTQGARAPRPSPHVLVGSSTALLQGPGSCRARTCCASIEHWPPAGRGRLLQACLPMMTEAQPRGQRCPCTGPLTLNLPPNSMAPPLRVQTDGAAAPHSAVKLKHSYYYDQTRDQTVRLSVCWFTGPIIKNRLNRWYDSIKPEN